MTEESTPDVSVIVCTRDRARVLPRALRGAGAQVADFSFEVLVVDNGSSDDTRAVVERVSAELPAVRYVHEPVTGLSRARNRGAAEARAPLLAYLDDDAEPLSGWLAAIRAAFAETEATIVSGPIVARFEVVAPSWLVQAHLEQLSCQDLGPARRKVDEFPYVFGANLAIRRDGLARAGGFDADFGRSGADLLSGEDTQVCERVLAFGGAIVYEPAAVVHHWIPASRLSRDYFRRRAFATGRTRARQARSRLSAGAIAAAVVGKVAKLPAHAALLAARRAIADHAGAAESERSLFATLGYVGELARRSP